MQGQDRNSGYEIYQQRFSSFRQENRVNIEKSIKISKIAFE